MISESPLSEQETIKMGLSTIRTKVVEQAERIAMLHNQMNFLLEELYKARPNHEVFTQNAKLLKDIQEVINAKEKVSRINKN